MFHSRELRYLLWALTHYIHRLPWLICSDYDQTNLFVNERVWAGCWGCNGLKINWSLRSIRSKYFILFHFISVQSSLLSLFTFIPYLLQFHFNFISILFQCHFNFLSIFFLLYLTNYFSLLYFTLFYLILFYLPYHNFMPSQLQYLTPTTTLRKCKHANLDNWVQQILWIFSIL